MPVVGRLPINRPQEIELRDDLGALQRVLEKQTVVLGDSTDPDGLAFVDEPL